VNNILFIWLFCGILCAFLAFTFWVQGNCKTASRFALLTLFFPIAAPVGLVLLTRFLLKKAF